MENKFGSLDEAACQMTKALKHKVLNQRWFEDWVAKWGLSKTFAAWSEVSRACQPKSHLKNWTGFASLCLEEMLVGQYTTSKDVWKKKLSAYNAFSTEEWSQIVSMNEDKLRLHQIDLESFVRVCVKQGIAAETSEGLEPLKSACQKWVLGAIKANINDALGPKAFKDKLSINQINQCAKTWEVSPKELRIFVHQQFFNKVRWTNLNSSLVSCAEKLIEEFGSMKVMAEDRNAQSLTKEWVKNETTKRYQSWMDSRQDTSLSFRKRWFENDDLALMEQRVKDLPYSNESIQEAQWKSNQRALLLERAATEQGAVQNKTTPRMAL